MDAPSPSIGPAVRLCGLRKQYGEGASAVHALNGVDLEIPCGQFLSVMGPSGSGKSTLLHLVAGLDVPTDGWVKIGDVRIDTLDQNAAARFRRRHLGIIFQFFNLVPSLTVEENVALPFLLEGRRLRELDARVGDFLGALGIGALREKYPSTLSGGEMQRVAIARALVTEPMLLLADEPTGNLDKNTGEEIMAILRRLNREQNLTIVMVTHDRRIAEAADRTVTLVDGRAVAAKAA
jgi:putative ABC transport system ATP-binding protein